MFDFLFGKSEETPTKAITMKELEKKLLWMYQNRNFVSREEVETLFQSLLDTDFPMNDVCSSGPLFCFVLDLKPFLSLNIVKIMVDGGLDFSNVYMNEIAHRKMFRELDFNYSDTLWGIFVFLCQHTNFVQTLPQAEMFDIIFGRIMIENGNIIVEFEPPLVVFKVMLAYDKVDHRMKKAYLFERNFNLRHCIRTRFPAINNAILDS